MAKIKYSQGDVVIINLEPIVGSEEGKTRPCLVLSLDILNSTNITIAPITSKEKKSMPTHMTLLKDKYNYLLYEKNIILLENIRNLSIKRCERKLGNIEKEDLLVALDKINYNFRKIT